MSRYYGSINIKRNYSTQCLFCQPVRDSCAIAQAWKLFSAVFVLLIQIYENYRQH
jgi:hypothetical protein